MEFPFIVIELTQELPHPSFPRFLCVPRVWIQCFFPTAARFVEVAVQLPGEYFLGSMEDLVKSQQKFSLDWKPYWAVMHAGTVSSDMACKLVADLQNAAQIQSTADNPEINQLIIKTNENISRDEQCENRKKTEENPRLLIDSSESSLNEDKRKYKELSFGIPVTDNSILLDNIKDKVDQSKHNNILRKTFRSEDFASTSNSESIQIKSYVCDIDLFHSREKEIEKRRQLMMCIIKSFKNLEEELLKLDSVSDTCFISVRESRSTIIDEVDNLISHFDDNLDVCIKDCTGPNRHFGYFPIKTNKRFMWTLRYPELFKPKPVTVELLPNSGIYVCEGGLAKCTNRFEDYQKFSRRLMQEVFSDEALQYCTINGEVLDERLGYYAIVVLKMYINEFCMKYGHPITG